MIKEYKFLVQFEDGTEKEETVCQYKDNYIDRSIAVAAVRRRYKGIKKIKSIKNAPDKTIV